MRSRVLWVGVTAGVGLLLGGCQASYTVDLRNRTDEPVRATITGSKLGKPTVLYREEWLGPGDRSTIGPAVGEGGERFDVTADSRSNAYAPVSERLRGGRTTFDIERTEDGRLIFKKVGR